MSSPPYTSGLGYGEGATVANSYMTGLALRFGIGRHQADVTTDALDLRFRLKRTEIKPTPSG